MQLRRRDVEKWMSHRRLPEDLRRFLYRTYKANLYCTPPSPLKKACCISTFAVTICWLLSSNNIDLVVFHG